MEGSNFTHINKAASYPISRAEGLHNIQAEQELIGALFIHNDVYHKISEIIKDDHFYDPLHKRIFKQSVKLINAGRQATPVTLKEYFEHEEPINGLPVNHYLARLATGATSILNAVDYAETIYNLYVRREAVFAGESLVYDATDTAETPHNIAIERAQDALDKLTNHGGHRENTLSTIGQSASAAIEAMKSPIRSNTISTGFYDLDKALGGGVPRSELTIAAARPSVGKSAFSTSIALKAAKQGNEVFMFSLEMPGEAIGARCLAEMAYSRENPINYSSIMAGSVDQNHWQRLDQMNVELQEMPLQIDDQRGLSISNIKSRLRRYINKLEKEGAKPDLVIIDHIGKIRAEQYQGQRHLELGAITEDLAVLASDFDVAVLALCQLNRGVEGRDNKRPGLGDLRESGRIEEDASCVIGLHRPAYYLERMKCDDMAEEEERLQALGRVKNVFEASILKQRNGICRPIELWCDMPTNSFSNKSRGRG